MPTPLPALTVTVRVVPVPVTLPTDGPTNPLTTSEKLVGDPPVTPSRKVTRNRRVPGAVGSGPRSTMERTLGGVLLRSGKTTVPVAPRVEATT